MSALLGTLRANVAYAFFAVGAAWLAVAALSGSALLLWPVVACLFGGLLLRLRPNKRFTWAWVVATAVFGLLLAAYRAYAWLPLLGSAFSSVAAEGSAVFAVLALLHLFLIYAGLKPQSAAPPG